MKLPKIRENLLVKELDDEVLVYDKSTNKSYCLNKTAKVVFNACDGKKTFADLNLPEDVIYLCLDDLKKQNLIAGNYISPFSGMNRREVVHRVGLASMTALPLISSIIVPDSAHAASGNGVCTRNAAGCTTSGAIVTSNQPNNSDCLSSDGTGGTSRCCSCQYDAANYDPDTMQCRVRCS